MYYRNLQKEMREKRIAHGDIARVLKLDEITVAKKMRTNGSFTLAEAEKIRSVLFPALKIEYLFTVGTFKNIRAWRSECTVKGYI